MDWRLLGFAAPPIIGIAIAIRWLTGSLGPMPGYIATILIYNLAILLPLCLWKLGPAGIVKHLAPRWPGRLSALFLLAVPLALLGAALVSGNASALPLGAIAFIILVSLSNGTMEELFWRGALLDRTDLTAIAPALAAFAIWHIALLPAQGVDLPGGALAMVGGALALGAIWMYARVRSGSCGAAVLSHIGVNLFAFADLWGAHLPG